MIFSHMEIKLFYYRKNLIIRTACVTISSDNQGSTVPGYRNCSVFPSHLIFKLGSITVICDTDNVLTYATVILSASCNTRWIYKFTVRVSRLFCKTSIFYQQRQKKKRERKIRKKEEKDVSLSAVSFQSNSYSQCRSNPRSIYTIRFYSRGTLKKTSHDNKEFNKKFAT